MLGMRGGRGQGEMIALLIASVAVMRMRTESAVTDIVETRGTGKADETATEIQIGAETSVNGTEAERGGATRQATRGRNDASTHPVRSGATETPKTVIKEASMTGVDRLDEAT